MIELEYSERLRRMRKITKAIEQERIEKLRVEHPSDENVAQVLAETERVSARLGE